MGVEPLSCCGADVCEACLSRWIQTEVLDNGATSTEVRCPSCSKFLDSQLLSGLLEDALLQLTHDRMSEREERLQRRPLTDADLGLDPSVLEYFNVKRCPACGAGVQKESETCHKMICRTCRAKFCFRCLHRLEYFNCGCTGAEHRFIDPVNGEIVAH